MDASAVIAMIGGIALLIGIFGGGLKAKEVEIPLIPGCVRILSSITGIILLGIAIWLSIRSSASIVTPTNSTATITSAITQQELEVFANRSWQDTGISVKQGDRIEIEYQGGLWTAWPGVVPPFDANGDPNKYICADLMDASKCIEPFPESNKGALIARIGVQPAVYIGNSASFIANQSGLLELRMNNSELPSDYRSLQGSITVKVTISRP